jgi:hypothetical protein
VGSGVGEAEVAAAAGLPWSTGELGAVARPAKNPADAATTAAIAVIHAGPSSRTLCNAPFRRSAEEFRDNSSEPDMTTPQIAE